MSESEISEFSKLKESNKSLFADLIILAAIFNGKDFTGESAYNVLTDISGEIDEIYLGEGE